MVIAALLFAAAIIVVGYFVIKAVISSRNAYRYPLDYEEYIMAAAEEYSLDPCLVAAVINTESSFDPNAVSPDGAVGLMQLLPVTAQWVSAMRGAEYSEDYLTLPQWNIDNGCWLLRYLIDRYDGSVRYALIAYNAGHARLEEWLSNDDYCDDGVLTVIPYRETENYVAKIERDTEVYRKYYGETLMPDG